MINKIGLRLVHFVNFNVLLSYIPLLNYPPSLLAVKNGKTLKYDLFHKDRESRRAILLCKWAVISDDNDRGLFVGAVLNKLPFAYSHFSLTMIATTSWTFFEGWSFLVNISLLCKCKLKFYAYLYHTILKIQFLSKNSISTKLYF